MAPIGNAVQDQGMNCTTTTPSPFPPPRPGTFAPPNPPHRPDAPSRRQRTQLSAAGWLAATGASLLLVASIIVVAGNWQSIDPIVRFSGLVAALFAVYFSAEAGRRRYPSTSTALATLAACLTAPVGIAAAATLDQPWPVCVLVGGTAALPATELQARRWKVPVLHAATVVAFGLAAVGLSALSSVPVAVIGAVGALVALLLGAERRSVALGVAVGVTPWLAALSQGGLGTGTLADIGVTGSAVAWSAPVSCGIAALVIAIVAHRHQNAPLARTALAVLRSGVVGGRVGADAGAALWWSLPAIVLLAAEAVAASRSSAVWSDLARRIATPAGIGVGCAALATPYLALVARGGTSAGAVASDQWYVPLGLSAVALAASAVGTGRVRPTITVVAAVAAAVAASATAGIPYWLVAAVAAIGWIVATVATPWSAWDATTATCTSWILVVAWIVDVPQSNGWLAAVVASGLAVIASCSMVIRNDEGFRTIVAAGVVGLMSGVIADSLSSPIATPDDVGTIVFLGLIAVGVTLRADRSFWPLIAAGTIAVSTIGDGAITWYDVAVAALFAAAVAGSVRNPRTLQAHLAAAVTTGTVALALAAAGVDAGTATVAASLAGIALTGLSAIDRRLVTAQTAGITASTIAVMASTGASPVFASIAFAVLGAQLAYAGTLTRTKLAALPGAAIAVAGTVSLWWTTGTNAWVIAAIAPYGADGTDVALGATVTSLLVAGWLVRRRTSTTTWLAYSPGLGMAGTWLVASQLEVGTDWATFGALIVGIVALGVGGFRRLGAPLVLGTAMVAATILVSAGPRLTSAPTWAWIATGGVGLLVVAALIERSERPLLPIGRKAETQKSLLEQFCEDFG